MPNTALPIWDIRDDIVGHLRFENRLVLVAPTGSGKTTQVPQMLLDAGLAGDTKIVVLQPRRVAARTVAARVAWDFCWRRNSPGEVRGLLSLRAIAKNSGVQRGNCAVLRATFCRLPPTWPRWSLAAHSTR